MLVQQINRYNHPINKPTQNVFMSIALKNKQEFNNNNNNKNQSNNNQHQPQHSIEELVIKFHSENIMIIPEIIQCNYAKKSHKCNKWIIQNSKLFFFLLLFCSVDSLHGIGKWRHLQFRNTFFWMNQNMIEVDCSVRQIADKRWLLRTYRIHLAANTALFWFPPRKPIINWKKM